MRDGDMRRILMIEDDVYISMAMKAILSCEGYCVSCSSSGEEGFKSIEVFEPDMVLLDLMLPDISGIQLLRRIRDRYALSGDSEKRLIIFVVSALSQEEVRTTALTGGADRFLAKPFDPAVLLADISHAFHR